MTTFLGSTNPVARKEHYCDLCNRIITPGERYNRQCNVGDDGLYTFRACGHCQALIRAFNGESDWWYDTDFGYSYEDIADYRPGSVATARLLIGWRRKWRRRDGSLYPLPEAVRNG